MEEEEELVEEEEGLEEGLGLETRGSTKSSSIDMLRKGVSLVCPGQKESEDEADFLVGELFLPCRERPVSETLISCEGTEKQMSSDLGTQLITNIPLRGQEGKTTRLVMEDIRDCTPGSDLSAL